MATERIDIVITENGSRVVQRNLEDIGSGAKKTNDAVELLKKSLSTLAATFGIAELIKYSDTLNGIIGRLKLVTNSTQELANVQNQLFQIAQRTRSSFEGTADLYTRLAQRTDELGLSQKQLLGITESVNKAMQIGGGSAESQKLGIIQLAQALGAGTLRGQDLNSVLEQTPRVAQAIAQGLGVPISKLKELGETGQLTSQAVVVALQRQGKTLDEEFSKLPVTISGAFQVLQNELLKFIGQGANASGTAKAISDAILLVANNIDLLAAAAAGFATAKIATILLDMGVAAYTAVAAAIAHTTALQTERAATIALATADVQETAAKIANLQATQAGIVAARADVIATLQRVDAQIAATQAQIAAARAAGALSVALALVREGEVALTAAMARRAVVVTELAVLGRQQASVAAATTAATVAQTAAQGALTVAVTAGGTAARLAGAALGLLGGPIGIITTLLGLGATAWALWGGSGKKAEQDVKGEIIRSTEDIIASLDKQIAKLKERNALANAGLPTVAKGQDDASQRLAELQGKVNQLQSQKFEEGTSQEIARREILRVTLEQYGTLLGRIQSVGDEQAKLDAAGRQSKLAEYLDKYADKATKLKDALAEARAELGDKFTPELEKLIRSKFADKGGTLVDPILKAFQDATKALAEFGQDEVTKKVVDFQALGATGAIVEKYKTTLTQLKDLKTDEEVKKLTDALKEQIATVGLSAEALEARKIAVAGATVEQIRYAESLADNLAVAKNRAEVDKTIEGLRVYRDELGLDNGQLTLQRIALAGATTDQLNYAKAIIDGTRVIEDRIAKQQEIQKLADDFKKKFNNSEAKNLGNQISATQTLVDDPRSGFGKEDQKKALVGQNKDLFAGSQELIDLQLDKFKSMYEQIDLLRQKDIISEETAAKSKAAINVQEQQLRLQGAATTFSTLAQLQNSGNAKLAAVGRVAAIAQATMDGYLAVQKALASAPPPYNYIAAAAVGVVAAANVAKIAGVKGFEVGGYTGDGSRKAVAGVVHGAEFVINADATAKNRRLLEAINRGADLSRVTGYEGGGYAGTALYNPSPSAAGAASGANGAGVIITINNNAPGTEATKKEKDTPNGREIEITIGQVVAKQIRQGGPIADAAEAQWGLNRASGTVR